MASYSLELKPSAEKDLRKLTREILLRVLERIEDLQRDPFPSQVIRLTGVEKLFRIRVGDYRIVYEVQTDTRRIVVHYVRHRREVYRSV